MTTPSSNPPPHPPASPSAPASPHSTPHATPLGHGGAGPGEVPLVLIGGGGHALVVMEAAGLAAMRVEGFLDDNPAAPVSAILIDLPHPFPSPRHLGNLEEVHRTHGRHWIVAIGDVTVRRKLLRLLLAAPDLAPMPRSVVHPTAFVSPSAVVGPGTYIGPRAVVHARARIGAHCIVNSGAVIEHDCAVGENTHIAPGAVLGGAVKVGHDALIGLGCRILPGLSVGHRATVGAGAVVTKPVADHTTVTGVPAQVA